MEYKERKKAPWEDPAAVMDTMQQLARIFNRPVAFLDFEFNQSAQPVLNLVCCSIISSKAVPLGTQSVDPFKPVEFWLHNNDRFKTLLKDCLLDMRKQNTILVAYAAPAEARSLQALGIDPHIFNWVDLYAEWRQLTFNNYACQYGTYFTTTGYERYSVPPHFDKKRNKFKDNKEVGLGLTACVGQLFGVYIDSAYKTQMRDLIISNPPAFTDQERHDITKYCTSDIMPLPAILLKQMGILKSLTKLSTDEIIEAYFKRGSFMGSIAKMETVGFPLHEEAAKNLRNNYVKAREDLIEDLVVNYYPFYVRKAKPGPNSVGLIGDYVNQYTQFEKFLTDHHPEKMRTWPKTDSGQLSTAEGTLEKYDGIPEILALRQANKAIKQIGWFKAPDAKKKKLDGDFFDNVGVDGHLRAFLGAYGTQTSRNAPKASRFVLAMSNWLRCLIKPPVGFSIIAMDYASQEFAIAAIMSKDKNMIAAYESGDPYLYFAKKAGAVPQSAEPKKCKTPSLVLLDLAKELKPDLNINDFFGHGPGPAIITFAKEKRPEMYIEFKDCQEYERQRNLFKATTLGLQYGMGVETLAAKLSADMGELITERDATKLINLHKKTYPTYWAWLDKIEKQYKRAKCLVLKDGWALLGDNSNTLSVRNFPVQGTGAVIMRRAVELLHAENVDILAPLHDALYCLAADDKVEEIKETQARCMLQAVTEILGDRLEIRLDIDIHTHQDTWVEGKGQRFYKLLGKYLKSRQTDQDITDRLLNTIYKRG